MVESELSKLESEGIISPVQFSHLAASIIPIMKKNDTLRMCDDYKVTVNRTLQVDSYTLPRVEELFASLSGKKYFTILDMSQVYLQVALEDESKQYVTINTHKGLFLTDCLLGFHQPLSFFKHCMENLL